MSEEKMSGWKTAVFGGSVAALIGIVPFIWGVVTDNQEKGQAPINQNQAIAKTEIHIHAPPGSTISPSADPSIKDKVVPQEGLGSGKTKIAATDSRPVNNSPETAANANDLKKTVITTTPVHTPMTDISGVWRFDANIFRGKDTSGTLFEHSSNYTPIVELTQTGTSITGSYSGPPAIICGSGTLKGSLQQDLATENIEWTLDCRSECEGEQRKFTGTFDVASKTITGRYKPVNTPKKKGCWLAYEKLSGKLE